MSAKEQYIYAYRIFRMFRVSSKSSQMLFHDGYLQHIAQFQLDILMKAWQTL